MRGCALVAAGQFLSGVKGRVISATLDGRTIDPAQAIAAFRAGQIEKKSSPKSGDRSLGWAAALEERLFDLASKLEPAPAAAHGDGKDTPARGIRSVLQNACQGIARVTAPVFGKTPTVSYEGELEFVLQSGGRGRVPIDVFNQPASVVLSRVSHYTNLASMLPLVGYLAQPIGTAAATTGALIAASAGFLLANQELQALGRALGLMGLQHGILTCAAFTFYSADYVVLVPAALHSANHVRELKKPLDELGPNTRKPTFDPPPGPRGTGYTWFGFEL